MSKSEISSRSFGVKGSAFVVIALALLACIAAFGGRTSTAVFGYPSFDRSLDSAVSPLDVTVSLPSLTPSPGVVLVPITVSDLTGQGIFSYDLQVTYNASVLAPASPAIETFGTLSSAMAITPNISNSGHFIIGAFQASPLDGSGTLIFLRFNVIGTAGQSSSLVFEDYTDPSSNTHSGFKFNDGTPAAITTNGNITVVVPAATSTSTSTPTSTATATGTPTNTLTATPTRTATNTPTPINTSTNTPTATATGTPAICPAISMPNVSAQTNTSITVPVNVSEMGGTGAVSANFTVTFDSNVMTFNNLTFGPVGTSNGGGRTLAFSNPTAGTLNISIFGGNPFIGSGAIVNLNFTVVMIPPAFSPLNFTAFQINGGPQCGTTTNGSLSVVTGRISGTVTYANILGPPSPRYVPNVLISAAGSPPVSTVTGASGPYLLSGFSANTYTITPSKTGGVNNAVTGFDAAKIVQFVVNLSQFTETQKTVADVSGIGGVSSYDASLISRYVVGLPPLDGNAGTWKFSPASIFHPVIYYDITNENYLAYLMGDVSGNWNDPNSLPGNRSVNMGGPQRQASVSAANIAAQSGKNILVPITVRGAADKGIIAYEFDLKYDPSVIQPQADPVDIAQTISQGLFVTANATEPGILRVTVYGATPLAGSGVLLNLRFSTVGAPGAVSPLAWERFMFNEGDPKSSTVDGSVQISSTDDKADISGRVLSAFGEGIANARVTLTDTVGRERIAISNGFGAYRFEGLQMGQTYVTKVSAKGHNFAPLTISVSGDLTSQDLIAEQ